MGGLKDELLKAIWHAFTALDLDHSGKVSKSQLKVGAPPNPRRPSPQARLSPARAPPPPGGGNRPGRAVSPAGGGGAVSRNAAGRPVPRTGARDRGLAFCLVPAFGRCPGAGS